MQKITEEIKEIQAKLDEYVWYNMPNELQTGFHAKSGLVLTALMTILVKKEIITLSDVKELLESL